MGKVFRETKAIVRSFVSFLYQPSDFKEERKSVFSYILAFGFIYLCAIGIRFVTLAIVNKLGTPIPRTIPPIDQSTLRFVLLGSFISPVIEEFLFRYPLKYTKNCLFICVLAFGLSAVFFNQVAMSSFTFNTQRLLIVLPIAVGVFLLTRFEKVNNVLQKFWQHYLIIILYISAIYFAQAHFPLPKEGFNLILLPFTVFPFLAVALYLSYLRLRVDFKYNVFFHIGQNTSLLLIPWLFS